MEDFEYAFGLFDRNNNGTILTTDLAKVLGSLQQQPSSDAELHMMINEIDPDGTCLFSLK
jgi:Ca2+-binding EF-hand superfamily protein